MISEPSLDHIEAAAAHVERQHATKPDPLAIPGVVRIPLGHHQAAMLAGLGECFVVITRASYPNQPGLGLLVLPVDKATADAACRVAMGKARAVKQNGGSLSA